MQVSDAGALALMHHEGIVPGPYLDAATPPVWTWGVGHTAAAGAPIPASLPRGMPRDLDATLAEVFKVFRRDVQRYADDVTRALRVPVEQHEFDALVSFHYNTGAIARAALTKSLNAGDREAAADGFMNWVRPASIIDRRKAEQALFRHGTYPTGTIPVWGVTTAGRVLWKPVRQIDRAAALEYWRGQTDPKEDLQRELKALGYYTGAIDGIWGPGSRRALDVFNATRDRVASLERAMNGSVE